MQPASGYQAPVHCSFSNEPAPFADAPGQAIFFYDTHAHLDDAAFGPDLADVLARARAAGVCRLITVGTDLASSRRCVALAEQHPEVFAAVGWHPTHALEAPGDLADALRDLARHPKVVAIGETGLDYYRLPTRDADGRRDLEAYKHAQARLFELHLDLAAELGLNVVVHQRAAFEDALAILGRYASRVRAQFHCFAEDATALERVLALGAVVSFTGVLTYKNAPAVRAALAAAPAGAFMFETDAPYLVPEPHRGGGVKRCEPAHLRATVELAAAVRGESLAALGADTCATARRFFARPH